ncbi:tyrosine-type recombinase/integrase [Flavobacteriaceae bacterium Ap0902]|nr:tyrosine-type recombinase/integrase [Flavobacteriaceae bacterium Ap0902]
MRYTKPKIYHGGKSYDLSKRWYIYYSFEHPTLKDKHGNPKKVRQTPISLGANKKYKTKKERLRYLRFIQKRLAALLEQGYSPYEENSIKLEYTAESLIKYALESKNKEVADTTKRNYINRTDRFIKFLKRKGLANLEIRYVTKSVVFEFLKPFEGKNFNNYKSVLSSLFTILAGEDYIERNFILDIPNKKVSDPNIKLFTDKEIENAKELLNKHDRELLLYVNLISYMFWRNIECNRITIDSIDLRNRTITTKTKTKSKKTKLIPLIILEDVQEFTIKSPTKYLLNSNNNLIDWENSTDNQRRNHYTKRFKMFKKNHKLPKDLTPYSFRHYSITKVYKALREHLSIEDAIKELSLITGHTSKAIFNYIHVHDLELPEDYSKYLKQKKP